MKKAPPEKKGSWPKEYSFLALIVIYICFLYSNSLHNDILRFDDEEYFKSPDVNNISWAGLKNIFTSYYLIMYQPLPVLSFALNFHFSGANPVPLHIVNLFLHLANTILVFFFLRKLTAQPTAALLIALFFGIHPMNVEAVSWISARSSSMYTLFYLLSLSFYLRYIKEGCALKHLLLTGSFFILSLFSKSQAVTLPVVLLLLDFLYRRPLTSKKVLVEKIPFFLLSVVFGIVTLLNKETQSNLDTGSGTTYSVVEMFFIVCHSFTFYIVKLFAPVKLCSIYVYPIKNGGLLPASYYASALLMVLLVWGLYRIRKNRELLFAAGLFLVTIAINIQIIPSRLFQVADRYAYFPYLGLFLFIAFFLKNKPHLLSKYRQHLVIIMAGFGLFFSFSLHARNKVWKNDEVLMTDIISKNPPVKYIFRAHGNRALYYQKQGRTQEAIADYTEALKLRPGDLGSHIVRGQCYFQLKNMPAALEDFNAAIKIDPKQHVLYSYRAQVRYTMHDTTGAIADCNKGLSLDSTNCDIYNTLAVIANSRKDYEEAIRNLSLAIRYKPDMTVAIVNRGLLRQQLGKKEEACEDFLRAMQLGSEVASNRYKEYCGGNPVR